MVRTEVEVNENLCRGCGFCTKFCDRGCIVIQREKFTPQGYMLPTFTKPLECNACGFCAMMCPEYALTVYLTAETPKPVEPAKVQAKVSQKRR
jgi:2-oxoglutarate ferredoxin oxidoreductase subunit delta